MKENREFDMLENANDNEIEFLAETSVLTKKEKDRMLKMSKNKLNKMNKESNIKVQISGVEQYKRPKWYKFTSIAACLVLVGGIAGTVIFMHKNSQVPDIAPMSAVSQDITDIDFDYAATVEELFNKINELNLICSGGGVEVDENVPMHYQVEYGETMNAVYYLVTDPRFSTLDEVKDYFRQYVADPLETSEYHSYFVDNRTLAMFQENKQDGSLYFKKNDDAHSQPKAAEFKLEKNDNGVAKVDIKPTDADDMNHIYEKSYDFSVPATLNDNACILRGKIVLDDGKLKMSEYSVDFKHGEETKEKDKNNLTAYAVLDKLVEFDEIFNVGKVTVDKNDTKELTIEEDSTTTYYRTYYHVTDSRFKNISDVKKYLSDSFTDSFLNEYSHLWEGETALFKEINGSLYYNIAGIQPFFYFFGEPSIEDQTTDSFRIDGDSSSDYSGNIDKVHVFCVKENGKWKIEKYTIN